MLSRLCLISGLSDLQELANKKPVHKIANETPESVQAAWVWWALGGEQKLFKGDYEFTEPELKKGPFTEETVKDCTSGLRTTLAQLRLGRLR